LPKTVLGLSTGYDTHNHNQQNRDFNFAHFPQPPLFGMADLPIQNFFIQTSKTFATSFFAQLKNHHRYNPPLRKMKIARLKERKNVKAAEFDFSKLHFLNLSD